MMVRARSLGIAVMAMALVGCSPGDERADDTPSVTAGLASRLDDALRRALADVDGTGVQAAVVLEDGRSWEGAAGQADIESGRRVTTDTLFAVGSVTKLYTAALILDLVASGDVDLEDRLVDWVPDFAAREEITLRQLLAHTSGLASLWPSEIEDLLEDDPDGRLTDDEVLLPPACDPGACYRYASPDYGLLGLIAETATDDRFARALHARLLDDLGLDRTFFPEQEEVTGPEATGYGGRQGPEPADEAALLVPAAPIHDRLPASEGGMVATAGDVAHFGHALFEGSLLAPALLDQMVDFDANVGVPGTLDCATEGLAIGRTSPLGEEAWTGGGFTGNFRTVLWHFPREGLTVVVTVNDSATALTPIAEQVAEVALSDAPVAHPDAAQGFCNYDLATITPDGTDRRWLTDEPGVDAAPASFSPDGEQIAFVSDRDGDFDVLVASADGTHATPVTDLPGLEPFPRWSPDGTRILFASDQDGDEDLYVVEPDGSHLRPLTDNAVDDTAPAWSPDGRRIAFSRGPIDDHDLWLADADGSHPRQLTDEPGDEYTPSWSPDGRQLVFGSGFDIRILDLAAGSITRLDLQVGGRWPTWGPTGRIAYVADGGDLWTVRTDGQDARAVAITTYDEFSPAWSPDGDRLLYAAGRWQEGP